ncbi:MAG: hypothetical protein PHH00_00835 [Candidatus Nanoarchaeia archaeon]|nr:hypothetical protein [Candidatus Nanoarchaeia archaeon]
MNKKRGFIELSFAWLFGIIAGAVILALAIFAATRIINLGQSATGAETQNQIAVLLNPLETSFQTGQVVSLGLPAQTRIYNECDYRDGIFGEQIISVSQQNLGKWSARTQGTAFQNKYIFSENAPEGKKFYLFSKPFDFPFKISDVIYMTSSSREYCFASPPDNVFDELSNLNEKNILLVESLSDCSSTSIKVCFHGENCDVKVSYNQGIVDKGGNETMIFYGDALMYGAIFSDKGIYECQLKRLMERATQLSSLYMQKENTIETAGCQSGLTSDLSFFVSLTNSFLSSQEINSLIPSVNQMEQKNDATICKLW